MKTFNKKVFLTVFSIVLFLAFIPAMAQYTKTSLSTGALYTALAKDAAGNVYVTKGAGGGGIFHVAKYTNGTGTPTIIYSGLTVEAADLPWGLAVAPNGDVYISTDFTANNTKIIRLNAASSYAATTVQTGRYFTGLTFDAAGNLYALEYNTSASDYAVVKYTSPSVVNSTGTMLYHGLPNNQGVGYPTGIAISPSGDIYVTKPATFQAVSGVPTYTGGILKINAPTYATTTSIATGTYATTLVLDEFGNLYAVESSGGNTYALNKYTNATGTPTTFYAGLRGAGVFLPYGVTFIGTTGYVADGDNGSGGELIKLVPTDVTPSAVPTGLAVAAATGQNTLTWTANGDADLLGYKVYGGTTASPTTLLASIPKGTTTFTHTGLTNGTTYYYRISSEDNYFNESAKTADATGTPLPPATAPTVTTGGNTPSYTSASLAGIINDNNANTTATFDWGLTNAYGSSVSATPNTITAGTGSTAVTGSLTSLLPGTTYYYRAKGVNSINTTNGLQGSFTTLSLPTVTTDVATSITTTSAVLGGNVTAAGSSPVTERGIVYSLTTNPTVANTKVQNGTGTGVFSATVGGLTSNTLYYVKAYAINGGGPSYGAEQTFTTASSTITAGSTFPAGLTTTYGVVSASTSITVSGTNIFGGITVTPSSTANFEVSADNVTYGPTATIGSSGTVSGTVYVRLKATAAANASITGSVTLTSTGANSPVITIPTSSVAKATLTYTADQKAKIYGTVIPALTGTLSGFVNSETIAVTTGTPSFTTAATVASSVGSFAITGTGLTAANYNLVQAASNATALIITQRPLTITANAGQTKTYGVVDPVLTYTVGGAGLYSTDTFSGLLGRAAGENVANYAITQGTLSAGGNYSITFTPGVTFAITQRAITVTATAGQTKTYGDSDPTLNYSITAGSLAFADTFTGSLSRAVGENVGTTYGITQGTLSINSNYSVTFTPGINFAITPRAVTVTASAGQSKTYGNVDPTLNYSITAGSLALTDSFSGSLSRALGENVNTYNITQGSLTAGSNYAITITPGVTFVITQRAVTVTPNTGQSKVYGNVNPTLDYTIGGSGLAFADSFTGALSRAAGENVNTYAITQGTLALSSNYAVTFTPAVTFAITQRPVTVTPNTGQSKIYGSINPTLSYSVGGSGLAFADTFTGALTRVTGENVGNYAITQGNLTLSSNYSVTFTSGVTFAITPKTLTVTATGINKAYDGTTVATVNLNDNRVTGDVFTESYASASFGTATIGTNKPVNVTGIAITGGASANYTLGNTTAATTADITASAIVITADAKSKIYGSADPALTYTYTGTLVGTDAFSGSLTRVAGSNVGAYAINQGTLVLSNAGNYSITYNSANLSVTPKTLTVTATGINKIYDGTTAATVTLSDDRVAGDVFTESYASAGFATATVGTNKPVSVAGIAITGGASANYTLGNTTAATTADITARAIVVTAVVKNKVYGSADPALTYTYTGTLIGTDAFTGSLSRVAGENVGAYAIMQGTLALGSNYSLTYNSANLNITPKTLTVTATGINKAYDGTTAATVNLNDNRVTGDVFTESYASASFGTATIGTNKPVSVTGIAITGGASANYTLGNTTAATTADITASAIVITADAKSKIYGSADPALTYTYTGTLVGTDAFSGSLTRVAGSNVGAYAINQGTLVLSNASNYNITYNSANLSITPKTLTVTATGINKIYDGTTAATVTLSDDRVAGDVFTESYASAAFATATAGTNKPVSVAGIAITGGASANYTLGNTTTATTADITARAIVVTADAKSKVYGAVEPTLTYTYTGTLIGTDAFTGALSRVVGENIGAYAINQGTLALSNNYSIAFNSADLTIGKKTVTVTAAAKSKTYGDADPALTYTFAPTLVTGDSFTGSLTRVVGETIGAYAINQGTLALNPNYTLTYVGDNLTIGKKTVTVTAAAKSKTYGDADPALTYTFAPALVTGDSFTGSLSRAVGETIGTYAINQGTLALSTNYTLTYVGDNLTIGKKTVTVTAAAKSKTYGDADPALTYTFAPALVTGDSFTGSLTRAVGETIGTYAINQGTLALNTNYTLTYVGDNLTIGKKTVTVTAAAKNKTYGDADPALTYTFAPALVTGDSFTGSLIRAVGETIGAYAINQGTLVLNPNYTLTYVGDNLTIGKKTVTVTAAAKSKTYGDADPALTYTFAPALVTGDSFTGSLTRAVGETIGTYAINQGTLGLNPNYTLTYVGDNLTIGKKTVTITAAAKSKTYGDTDPALTYTFAPALVTGDSFTGSLTRAAGETIGTYAINQGTLALNANYTLTYVGNNLTIGKKVVTVTAAAKSKTYGDADPTLTYTFAPALVTGDTFTGSLTRAAGETIGTYAINQGTLALNANYTLTYVGDNLTIGKKTITVTAAAKSKTYGDADPALTYTFAPALVTGDTFNGSITRLAGENVGTYAITQGTLALNSNYTLTYVGANLTIGAKTVTVTAAAKSKTYGDADPALTYTFAPALVTGDSFSGNLTRAAGENAGTYAINQGTLTLGANYAITYVGANLTINKAVLTVTASNAVMCQADAFPTFAVTYTGFRVGDTENSLTTKPTVSTTANRNVAGTYSLVPANGVSNNYSFVYVNGTLTINALPTANIVSNKGTDISKGDIAILTASGGTSYSWSTASGIISGQNTAVLTVRPAQTTTYTVRVTNASGCSSVTTITIKVTEDYKVVANNILTPNGDGVNDTWFVQNIDMYPNNEVRIFDRNGRLMYNKKGYDNSWNGTIGGNELAEGTYYYIITYGPDKLVQKGFITIIRNR